MEADAAGGGRGRAARGGLVPGGRGAGVAERSVGRSGECRFAGRPGGAALAGVEAAGTRWSEGCAGLGARASPADPARARAGALPDHGHPMGQDHGGGAVMSTADRPATYLLKGDQLQQGLSDEEIATAARDDAPIWVDIDSTKDEQWALLASVFHFHPLAVEDTRSPQGRVKIEEYGDYLFVVVRETDFATETPEPYDLSFQNLC